MTQILFIILLTLAVAISTSLLIILIYKLRPVRKLKDLLTGYTSAVHDFNLSISKNDLLGNSIIGLDDAKNKVLFVKHNKNKREGVLVDLKDIKNSTIKQIYKPKSERIPEVKSIALQLNFKNGINPILLPFYDDKTDTRSDVSERADQVIEWQTRLSAKLTQIDNAIRYRTNATKGSFNPVVRNIA